MEQMWALMFPHMSAQEINALELYKLGSGSFSEVYKFSDNSVVKVGCCVG